MHHHRALAAALLLALAAGSSASAAISPAHIRGTVTAITPTSFDVTTVGGVVHVDTTAMTHFVLVSPATRAAIRPNSFVGIATDGERPGAPAREVVVFPDSMRGTGEGHYAWDLPQGGSAMTNGAVAAHSVMTNGSVASSAAAGGPLVLNVTYKGGSNRITVPPSAPIVMAAQATRADLHAGGHVFVVANGANALVVIAGKGDTVPPM